MDPLQVAWVASLVVMGWSGATGAIRTLAYRSGQVDHTPGMRFVALLALAAGGVAAIAFVALSVVLVSRG